jgi:hypothetical protein
LFFFCSYPGRDKKEAPVKTGAVPMGVQMPYGSQKVSYISPGFPGLNHLQKSNRNIGFGSYNFKKVGNTKIKR